MRRKIDTLAPNAAIRDCNVRIQGNEFSRFDVIFFCNGQKGFSGMGNIDPQGFHALYVNYKKV